MQLALIGVRVCEHRGKNIVSVLSLNYYILEIKKIGKHLIACWIILFKL